MSLEEFAHQWLLGQERAREWRCCKPPTNYELRAMTGWVCSVSGGVAVQLTDCSQPGPYRRPG